MFNHSKENFKEIGKDVVTLGKSMFGMLKGIVCIPVALCKDIRDEYLKHKEADKKVKNTNVKASA